MLEVKRLRKARGWNQTELAYHAGLAPSVISQIENGKRDPTARTLRKLAEALGVGVRDLFPKGQAPLPFEGPHPLEASDEAFEEMVHGAGAEQLGAMKRELADHLPGGGPLPLPRPTDKQLVAVRRCIAIHQEQERRNKAEKKRLEAERTSLQRFEAVVSA